MRLFAAIDLDDGARQAIAAEQQRLQRAFGRFDRSLRWVRPEQMHLTLVFIGNADDARASAIAEAMSADIDAPAFAIVFGGLGVFPPHGAPSVLWLGVSGGAREAIDLQRSIATRLEKAGVPREPRPYHPHLTLARWRSSRGADRLRVRDADRGAAVARVEAASVTLYRSQLSPAGPSYTPLATARLQT